MVGDVEVVDSKKQTDPTGKLVSESGSLTFTIGLSEQETCLRCRRPHDDPPLRTTVVGQRRRVLDKLEAHHRHEEFDGAVIVLDDDSYVFEMHPLQHKSGPRSTVTYISCMHYVQRPAHRVSRHETPGTLGDALRFLAEPGSRVIAGGTDLLVELARGGRTEISTLVDLTRIPGLDEIRLDGDRLSIGALVTHNDVVGSAVCVSQALPLAQASWEIAAPALRNRATVIGNLVTASPANDTISALHALDATVVIRSVDGSRRVRVTDFFLGIRRTVLEPGELVTAVEVPVVDGRRGVFVKLGQRRAQAISVVHVAVVIGGNGERPRIALGSIAPTIVAATAAEDFLDEHELDDATITEAARLAAAGVTPIDDIRGSATYRRDAVEVLVARALRALRDGTERSRWPSRPISLRGRGMLGHTGTAATHHIESPVECSVNGDAVSCADATGRTLLDWLRDSVGLTGTKEGCAEGECGSCTVHIDGTAVLACLVPAARAHGSVVTTIEGLDHPLQQAFCDQFAVQCGFCIPGFLMAGVKLLEESPRPSRAEVTQGLSGNLCRCTGYYRFYDAIDQVAR